MRLDAETLKKMLLHQLDAGPEVVAHRGDFYSAGGTLIAFQAGDRPIGTITQGTDEFVVSVGKKPEELDALDVRELVGNALIAVSKVLPPGSSITIAPLLSMNPEIVARAARLALLRPGILKSKPTPEPFSIVRICGEEIDESAVTRGDEIGRYENVARLLALVPPNHLDVRTFGVLVSAIFSGMPGVSLIEPNRKEYYKMELARAVCAASEIPPLMLAIRIEPDQQDALPEVSGNDRVFAIAGKGLIFDSGGQCLKPQGGRGMKHDKTGACVALACALWAARNRTHLHTPVVAGLGIAENAVGPNAYRVGDVYTGYNGTTVEIDNTDAEGRLVLADLIAWLCHRFLVHTVVSVCTLTGAAMVGVGRWASALHVRGSRHNTEKKALADQIRRIGLDEADPVNLLEEPGSHVVEQMASDIADFRNSSGGDRNGGSQQGFYFLCQAVHEDVENVLELDIAGSVDCEAKGGGGIRKGTTRPAGVALLIGMMDRQNF